MERTPFIRHLTLGDSAPNGLHFAFCNVLMFTLAGIALAGIFAVYKVMYMFLTPLLWAVLVGTILFPVKRRCYACLNGWVSNLESTNTPLAIGFLLLPYQCYVKLSDCILFYCYRLEGLKVIALYLLIKLVDYGDFISIIGFFGKIYSYMDDFVVFYTQKWMVAFTVLYSAGYVGWIYVQDRSSVNKKLARLFSVPIWLFVLCLISSFCGPLKPLILIVISVLLGMIAAGLVSPEDSKVSEAGPSSESGSHEGETGKTNTEPTEKSVAKALTSDSYIQIIFGLCVVLFAARHDWVVLIVIILGLLAVMRKIGDTLGLQEALTKFISMVSQQIALKLDFLIHVSIAGHMREFIKILFTSDKTIRNSLRSSLDMLSSIFVMCFLAFTFIFMVLFSAIQLHSEASRIVVLTSNVIAKQPEWILMSAKNYTQDTLSQHDIDDYVDQAYVKGRELLAENVRKLVGPSDIDRADRLEKQIMQFVDELYRMWEERGSLAKNTTLASNDNFFKVLKSADIVALKSEVINIMKENVETILNVLHSIWNVAVLNLSLITSIVVSLAGILLEFGLNVVNFFIEMVVFVTAVYYLLISSKERWIPLKWISDAVPTSADSSNSVVSGELSTNSFSATEVTNVIESAISGVFVLSAKMATFYGLYTYFVHSLFGLEIVFVPSILATLFGAVPIMAPYTVSIIGVIELLLVRGEFAATLIFVLATIAPMFFADPAFYKELKGSHPYVTGLSIVGGIYWLGLQGAIFGPLLLCSMIVLFNIYTKYTKSTRIDVA